MEHRDPFLIPPRRSKPATSGARVLATLYGQFRKPTGLLGWVAGWIMAHRASNTTRNRWTVDLLNIKETDHVLEIGFGPGLSIASAARLARQGVVVGIDHSVLMLRTATHRNHAAIEAGRVELKVGELESLPTLGETFDKAFSVNVFQFVEDRREAYADDSVGPETGQPGGHDLPAPPSRRASRRCGRIRSAAVEADA